MNMQFDARIIGKIERKSNENGMNYFPIILSNIIPVATPAFSDSARPTLGMVILSVIYFSRDGLIP